MWICRKTGIVGQVDLFPVRSDQTMLITVPGNHFFPGALDHVNPLCRFYVVGCFCKRNLVYILKASNPPLKSLSPAICSVLRLDHWNYHLMQLFFDQIEPLTSALSQQFKEKINQHICPLGQC